MFQHYLQVRLKLSDLPGYILYLVAPQQLLINNNIISTNGFVPSTSITANVPLWCQGSSSSDIITWTLPDGTILTANSGPASGAQVVTAPGQLGLISSGLDDLPSGVYTCTVNGSRSLVQIGTTVGKITINL